MKYAPSEILYRLEGECIIAGEWKPHTSKAWDDKNRAVSNCTALNARADYRNMKVHAQVTFAVPFEMLPVEPMWDPTGEPPTKSYLTQGDLVRVADAVDHLRSAQTALAHLP